MGRKLLPAWFRSIQPDKFNVILLMCVLSVKEDVILSVSVMCFSLI